MRTILVAFVLALAATLAATPLVRAIAVHIGAIDHALSSRKIHGRPVPRMGGLAVVLAFYVPLAGLFFWDTGVGRLFWENGRQALALIVGGCGIAALGVFDDLRGSGATKKLVVQFAVAALMWWAGFRIERISTPFGSPVELHLLAFPMTLLWIAGITNALNLIDGLDGLAGGVALAAVGAMFFVSFDSGQFLMALFMASLGGALLGFLAYNFHPASIFLGDTGSMFLGFVLATTSLQANQKASTAVALLVPIVALGLPIGDTLLAMARRAIRGQRIFAGDRRHIHHRLMDLGLSQAATVLVLYGVCIILAGVSVALSRANASQTVGYLAGVLVLAVVILTLAGYIGLEEARKLGRERKRNLKLRAAVRAAGESLRLATGLEDVWRVVKSVVPALGASCAALAVVERNGDTKRTEFAVGFEEAGPEVLRARYSLLGERPDEGGLELGWADGRKTVDRDTEIAVELLCEHVYSALQRFEANGRSSASEDGKVIRLKR